MDEGDIRTLVGSVWARQSVWSQTANLLKARIDRLRSLILALVVASATLTTVAAEMSGLDRTAGRVLALAAGVAVGLVPIVRVRLGSESVSRWTRARAVSEELKSEVFRFLAGVRPYDGEDRLAALAERSRRVQDGAADLLPETAEVSPVPRSVPEVHDLGSYVEHRLVPQVRWYAGQAKTLSARLRRARQLELALSIVGVVLAAAAATLEVDQAAAWVAVVTTVTAALSAHVAAARWEYQLVEYLRTEGELNHLHQEWMAGSSAGPGRAEDLVDRCEHVVSVQNEGWMAKWTAERH
jgi:hypothetical protein